MMTGCVSGPPCRLGSNQEGASESRLRRAALPCAYVGQKTSKLPPGRAHRRFGRVPPSGGRADAMSAWGPSRARRGRRAPAAAPAKATLPIGAQVRISQTGPDGNPAFSAQTPAVAGRHPEPLPLSRHARPDRHHRPLPARGGRETSQALGFALAAQALLILSGAAIFLAAVAWRTSLHAWTFRPGRAARLAHA
jgi:hypothetical protein